MKTFMNVFGSTLIFLGLMAVAGSAGDCDGACMDQANSIGVMLLVTAGGFVSMALGAKMMWMVR
jgi:hypothetical protein